EVLLRVGTRLSSPPPRRGGDQLLEQPGHPALLRMALHAADETAAADLDPLDDAVLGPRRRHHPPAEVVDRLMVVGGDVRVLPERGAQPAAGPGGDRVFPET